MENNNITKKDLEEQTQILLTALDNRFGTMEKRMSGVMDVRFGASAVRFDSVDKRIDEMETNLGEKIDKIQT